MAQTFTVTDEQVEDARKWIEAHEQRCPLAGQYLGAIGGKFTYSFTDTSIGRLTNLGCACGERTCLTEPFRDI